MQPQQPLELPQDIGSALTATSRRRTDKSEREATHASWKRTFFEARPPPPSIGRLHRRQREPRPGRCALGARFARACALVRTEAAAAAAATAAAQSSPCTTLPQPSNSTRSSGSHDGATVRIENDGNDDDNDDGNMAAEDVVNDALPCTWQRRCAWLRRMRAERLRRCPATDVHICTDPRRTVIVANIGRHVVEDDLRRFAEQFGRVVQVRLVRHCTTGKLRGYGFVEFGLQGEARKAVQHSRRRRLRGRLVVLDMERGRLDHGFLPRRLATAAAYEAATAATVMNDQAILHANDCTDACAVADANVAEADASPTAKLHVAQALVDDDDDDAAFLRSILGSCDA